MFARAGVVMLLLGSAAVSAAPEAQCETGACGQQPAKDSDEELLNDVTLLQTRVVSVDGEVGKEKAGSVQGVEGNRDIFRIICPFLSTLVNEGVLPNKNSYSKQELQAVTLQAGLAVEDSDPHIFGNFVNQDDADQDLFAMEGAPNEHATSTGVHDCPTLFKNCYQTDIIGTEGEPIKRCENVTFDCELPNAQLFERFWNDVDTNADGVMSKSELNAYTAKDAFPFIVDANPIGGGTIRGSHQFILDVFGVPASKRITKEALFSVFIKREFPAGYVFPSA